MIFVGTYKPFSTIMKKARAAGIAAKFITVSFIGTSDFINEAGADGEGVYITQVMPSPADAAMPVVKQFQQDMKGADVNYTSLEGYVNAMVLVEALKKAGPNPTRAGLVSTLEAMKTDLGGLDIGFSDAKHQGSGQVFLTQVRGGKPVSINKL